jgi:hypothetical protein
MSKWWFATGCLLLAVPISVIAADLDPLSAVDDIAPAATPIPILSATTAAASSTDHFSVSVDPLITQRAPGPTGQLADSADEHVGLAWHLPVFSLFTVGYDSGINAFRQDQTIFDDNEATSQVTTAFINKASVIVKSGSSYQWTGYVQGTRSYVGGFPGYTDATQLGTEAAWNPFKDITTVKVNASTTSTQPYNLNRSILEENIYGASIDQKLPYVPLTLHTAGSITDDTVPLVSGSDKDSTEIDASLLWKIVDNATASAGVQLQDCNTPSTITLQNAHTVFTQLAVQPADICTVTMRAAHEQRDTSTAGQFVSTDSDVLLSLGLSWKFNSHLNAGAGIDYRVLQSQTPAPVQSIPPATISLSAGGNF